MTDMPTHTPFPGSPDVTEPEYEPGGPDMPDAPDIPPEMPAGEPFDNDGRPAA